MSKSSVMGLVTLYRLAAVQLPVHACGNTFSGEPDAGKSACPVRRGESGSHRKGSPSLLLYRLGEILFLLSREPISKCKSKADRSHDSSGLIDKLLEHNSDYRRILPMRSQ